MLSLCLGLELCGLVNSRLLGDYLAASLSLEAEPAIVIKLSVGRSVGLSVCELWKNGGSDPDAVWHHRSDGSRDEAGSAVWGSVHGKEYFWGRIWGAPL